jgi:hypothetical protein
MAISFIRKTSSGVTVAVVRTNAGSDVIDLATLAVTGQTVSNPKVSIGQISYSVASADSVTIARNGTTIYKLFGHDTMPYGSSDQNDQNITVTFSGAGGGTCIMELGKSSGYGAMI